jgi:hypothetical protein
MEPHRHGAATVDHMMVRDDLAPADEEPAATAALPLPGDLSRQRPPGDGAPDILLSVSARPLGLFPPRFGWRLCEVWSRARIRKMKDLAILRLCACGNDTHERCDRNAQHRVAAAPP